MPPIFISTILQSVRKEKTWRTIPYDVKLRLLAHSQSFLANQKARNAIVGAENLLNYVSIPWPMEPINQRSARNLKVNALSELILWIYQHEFSNRTRNFNTALKIEFIVSERVQVNPENSRAMSG